MPRRSSLHSRTRALCNRHTASLGSYRAVAHAAAGNGGCKTTTRMQETTKHTTRDVVAPRRFPRSSSIKPDITGDGAEGQPMPTPCDEPCVVHRSRTAVLERLRDMCAVEEWPTDDLR